jgi:hypothetical protein
VAQLGEPEQFTLLNRVPNRLITLSDIPFDDEVLMAARTNAWATWLDTGRTVTVVVAREAAPYISYTRTEQFRE